MEPGGKRRKKLSKGFGRVFASCSYCLNEAISSLIEGLGCELSSFAKPKLEVFLDVQIKQERGN